MADVSTLDCESCNKNKSMAVCSSGLAPYSGAICRECAENHCEPLWIVDATLDELGGASQIREDVLDGMTVYFEDEYVTIREYAKRRTLIHVLDHGFVRRVDSMGDDLAISRAARVSYNAEAREEDEKLISYLYRNKHTSPFEAVVFTFEVKAPIFVLRQWHRHRTWSYNEVSARYTELPDEYYVPAPMDITTQSKDNKQMRTNEPHPQAPSIQTMLSNCCYNAHSRYRRLLELGCPRELARSVLPVATYSRMFATVDLHNLFHFLRLRLHEHAQYEIRAYAEAMLMLIEPIVPLAVRAFRESL